MSDQETPNPAKSEFHDPIDPSILPKRRCSKCGGEMVATDAGEESYSPIARYTCTSCNHTLKITPLESSGVWIGMGFVAWVFIAGFIYLMAKPFDAWSVLWIGIWLVVFMGPFVPGYLKNKRHPIIDGAEPGVGVGLIGNLAFLAALFGVVLGLAAAASILFGG